jgi:hypothetical protein
MASTFSPLNATNLPAKEAIAITPSDTVNISAPVRAIYVGVTGNVTVFTWEQSTILFTAVPAGALIPIGCLRINSTGTTASGIVGLV